jgi:CheY-like chemotaxis protein
MICSGPLLVVKTFGSPSAPAKPKAVKVMNTSELAFIPKVLLVDDEVQQLQLRATVMASYGFSVVTADGPTEAISTMAEDIEKTDVAILDYNMPVMNGSVLAARLRSMCPRLKIILHSGAIDIPQGEMTNVDAYVPKSDGIASLIAKVVQFTQTERETLLHSSEPRCDAMRCRL